jgi:putative intracellular protease/amidase
MIIADGFKETETIILLSALRQAGLWVKSVGLTSGLIGGAHGVWLMPDLTLADIDHLLKSTTISLVVLPEGRQSLVRLKTDPRVHQLLRQVVAQQGQIVTSPEGLQVSRAAAVWVDESGGVDGDQKTPILLRDPAESLEAFAQGLIRRLRK